MEHENNQDSLIPNRVVREKIKTTLSLSILEYTHPEKFDSVYVTKNTLLFAVFSAHSIPVEKAALTPEQDVGSFIQNNYS